jgi:hypothetical protein
MALFENRTEPLIPGCILKWWQMLVAHHLIYCAHGYLEISSKDSLIENGILRLVLAVAESIGLIISMCRRAVPVLLPDDFCLSGIPAIVGGHDLHIVLVETVLDILMEFRIDSRHHVRCVRINVQLIPNIEIIEAFLEYKGRRFLK